MGDKIHNNSSFTHTKKHTQLKQPNANGNPETKKVPEAGKSRKIKQSDCVLCTNSINITRDVFQSQLQAKK